jgi:Na+/melibiose symporter-like transporter
VFFYAWAPLFFLALALIWCVPAALAPVGATFPAAGGGIGGINATVAAVALAPHPLLFLNVVDAAGAQRTPTSTPGVFSTSSVLIITATYLIGEILKALVPVGLPWMSLGAEVTQDGSSRTSLFTVRSVFALFGHGIGASAPMLLLWYMNNDRFAAFSAFVAIAGGLLVVLFWILACNTVPATAAAHGRPGGCAPLYESRDAASSTRQTSVSFVAGIMLCMTNGPYMRLWCAHAVDSLGGVLAEGMLPFFVQYVLNPQDHGQGSYEFWVSTLLCIGFASSAVATPIWEWFAGEGARAVARQHILRTGVRPLRGEDWFRLPQEWWAGKDSGEVFRAAAFRGAVYESSSWNTAVDKRFCWLAGWAAALPAAVAAYAAASPGNTAVFCALVAWGGLTVGGTHFLIRPMRADCIDYAQLRTGLRQEASFVMMMEILPHFLRIPSTALSLALLSQCGYHPALPAGAQPRAVRKALVVILVVAPMVCSICAFMIAYSYPLTDRLHEHVLRALSVVESGGDTKEPITGGLVVGRPKDRAQEEKSPTSESGAEADAITMDVLAQEEGQQEMACDSFRVQTLQDELRQRQQPGRDSLRSRETWKAAAWALLSLAAIVMYAVGLVHHLKMKSIACLLVASGAILVMIFHLLRIHAATIVRDLALRKPDRLATIIRQKLQLDRMLGHDGDRGVGGVDASAMTINRRPAEGASTPSS